MPVCIHAEKPSQEQIEDSEKSPKGQLMTQTFGIIKRKPVNKRNYTCIGCGAKCKSKQEINQHYREKHSAIKCPDCDRVFPTPDSLQRHAMLLETNLCVINVEKITHSKMT